jgi:iron(III) transport system substrate-binding protein
MALEQAFEAEHGDVLDYIGGPWCRKLKAEQEAGEISADVIYGAEPIFYDELALDGALYAYASPEEANLRVAYQWETSDYTVADLRYIGIVYNKDLVSADAVPTAIDGLNDAAWYQMTTIADATQCSSAFAMAGAQVYPDIDFRFFEAASANGALLSDRAGKLPSMVASGEAALGLGPHDAVVRLQNKARKEGVESPVSIVWPTDGVYVVPRPIAIIADENRSDEATAIAEALVDFVLSEAGQKLSVQKGGFVPARAGVSGPNLVPDDLELIETDWDWVFANRDTIRDRFTQIMYGD